MKAETSAAPRSGTSSTRPAYSAPHSGKSSRRRFYALVLAAATLWAVGVTAGSDTPASALSALRKAVMFSVPPDGKKTVSGGNPLEGENPDVTLSAAEPADIVPSAGDVVPSAEQNSDFTASAVKTSGTVASVKGLSLAAAVALRQSPVLYSVREDVLSRVPETSAPASPGTDTQIPESSRAQAPENSRMEAPENYDGTQAVPLSEEVTDPDSIIHMPQTSGNGENTPDSGENGTSVTENPDNGIRAKTLVPTGTNGYTVCGKVYISSSRGDSLSVSALTEPFDAGLTDESPQILILHTHGSEAYTPAPETNVVWSGDSRTTDFRYSVVKAGDEMAAVFSDAGISVLHDRTLYDYPNYTGSYDRSLAAIQSYMAQYPSIRFILDVHRDYISDSKGNPYKVISEIDGVGTAAQMTLVMGSDGSGLYHPDWMENLKLAVAIQEQLLSEYPTLMRPVLLRRSRYNQHVTTGSLLVEVGTAGNSPEEAFLSARLFARGMVQVLQDRSK